jgi:hypothetical protein
MFIIFVTWNSNSPMAGLAQATLPHTETYTKHSLTTLLQQRWVYGKAEAFAA